MQWRFHNATDTEVKTQGDGSFEIQTHGTDDHIRVIIDIPADIAGKSHSIDIELELSVISGAVSHLALMNGSVSESRMIDVPELQAPTPLTFTVSGVFRESLAHALVVIITKEPTCITLKLKQPAILPVAIPEKIRVLFYIEPWIERDDALTKQFYFPWFQQQAEALRQAYPGYEFLITGNEALQASLLFRDIDLAFKGVSQESLLKIFPSSRDAITTWCHNLGSASQVQAMQDLVRQSLGTFTPSVIFATAPAPYLKSLFPEALLLYIDGLNFRAPWPDSVPMHDPMGTLVGTAVEAMARETVDDDPTAVNFMVQYRAIVDRNAATLHRFVAPKVDAFRARFDKIVLLSLQEIQYHNVFCAHPYMTQIDYVVEAMEKIDPAVGVIITQHPLRRDIDSETMAWLKSKYPNLLAEPWLDELRAPSQALMPHIDALVTTSSGLIYLAAIYHKPAFLTHPSHFSALAHTRTLTAIRDPGAFTISASRCDTEIAWVLRYYAFTHSFLLHTSWLHDRLVRQMAVQQAGALSWRSLPRISSDTTILDWLSRHLRPGEDESPEIEKLKIDEIVQEWDASDCANLFSSLVFRRDILNIVRPNGVGIELGVAEGHFSEEILESSSLKHLFSVDMYKGDRGHDNRQYMQAVQRLSPYQSRNTLIKLKFEEAINLFPDEYFDFIYIDGYAHTGEEGGKTMHDWFCKLKFGGVISGHDYSFSLVRDSVDKFSEAFGLQIHVVDDKSAGWNCSAASWFAIKSKA
jgi:Methyltransferase domain